MLINEVVSSFENGKKAKAAESKKSASTEFAKDFFKKLVEGLVFEAAKSGKDSVSIKLAGGITEHFNLWALRKLLRKEGFSVLITESLDKEECLILDLSGWASPKKTSLNPDADFIELLNWLTN